MVEINPDPNAGGNRLQPDDGRDADGRLPEPLDAAHWPPAEDGPAIVLPGMAAGQPAGTGPVISTPVDDGTPDVQDSPAAQGEAPPAPPEDYQPPESVNPTAEGEAGGLSTDTAGALVGKPAKRTSAKTQGA